MIYIPRIHDFEKRARERSSKGEIADSYQKDDCNLHEYFLIFFPLGRSVRAVIIYIYICIIAIRDLPADSYQRPSEEIFHVGYHDDALCNHDLALYMQAAEGVCVYSGSPSYRVSHEAA